MTAMRVGPVSRWLGSLICLALVVGGCGSSGDDKSTVAEPSEATAFVTPPPLQAASGVVRKVRIPGTPCGVAGAAGSVWVSDADRGRLFRVDPITGKATETEKLDATPCEMTSAFGSLWVVTQSGRLDRVDPKTGKLVARISVGDTSYEAVATEDAIWVSNRNNFSLSRVNPRKNRVTFTLQIRGAQPGGLAYADGALWVGDDTSGSTRLLRVDPKTHKVSSVKAGDRPAYVAASADAVWVSNQEAGTVSRIDPQTARSTATIPVDGSPVNLDVLPGDAPEVWVPDDLGDRLVRIDATTARVIEVVPVGSGPAVVAPVDGDVWATMFHGHAVWQVQPGSLS